MSFSTSLQAWTEINLPGLQQRLDDQALALKEEQRQQLLSRKHLAAQTKDFRKLPDDEKITQVKPLLKLYQNEIDTLTTSKKTVEGHFFALYRVLAEAPDPKPLLEASLDAVATAEDAAKDKDEVRRLHDELAKRADYDQLKQRLLRTEQKAAETLATRLAAQEDEFRAIGEEKERNWRQKEEQLGAQIRQAQRQIEELRSLHEVRELQTNSAPQADASASVRAELDIVSRDAEALKRRVLELERRNEDLRKQMSQAQSGSEVAALTTQWETKVSELEGETATLVASLAQTRAKLEHAARDRGAAVEQYARESALLAAEVRGLKARLEHTHDYDEIKSELQMMRQIEFGLEDDDDAPQPDSTPDAVLVHKNSQLTKQLADLRAQHEDFTKRVDELERALEESRQEVTRLLQLNARLEADLASSATSAFNDNASMISGVTRSVAQGTARDGAGGDTGILAIVTKQRDRFRVRNKELEEEVKKQSVVQAELRRQMNALKADNEQLYERTRYVATFGRRGPNADLEANAYQQDYERKLHPIEQFRMREQERISSRLGPVERMFVSLTRAILATRATRLLFFAYCVGLHAVVMFVTLYVMSMHTAMTTEVGRGGSTGGIPGK